MRDVGALCRPGDTDSIPNVIGTEKEDRVMSLTKICVCAFTLVAMTATTPIATTAGRDRVQSSYPGVRLAIVRGVPVFDSTGGSQIRQICPRKPLWLGTPGIRLAAFVVAHAMPGFYRHAQRQGTPIDARAAVARAFRSAQAHSGETFHRFCGPLVWRRSVFVTVRLPRVRFSASLSQASFEVARTWLGWIIWAEVH